MRRLKDTTRRMKGQRGALRALRTGNLPLLTLGLAIVWIASHLVVEIGYADRLEGARVKFRDSVEYFIEHPMLRISPRMLPVFRDAMPGYEGNEVFSFLSEKEAANAGPSPPSTTCLALRSPPARSGGRPSPPA